ASSSGVGRIRIRGLDMGLPHYEGRMVERDHPTERELNRLRGSRMEEDPAGVVRMRRPGDARGGPPVLMQRFYWTIRCRLLLGGLLFVLPLVLLMMAFASRECSRDVVDLAGGCLLVSVPGCTGLACIFLALSDLRNPFQHRLLGHLRGYGH